MEAPFLRLSENFCSPWSTHVFQPLCVLLTRSLPAIMNCQLPTMVISPQTIAFIEMIMVSPAAW
jgi:hypothetical protein